MIDPLTEPLIRPDLAAALYPVGADGKPVHVSRVYRDMKHGRDGIRLEFVRTPRLATSREAVARFFHRLTEAAARPPVGGSCPSRTNPRRADRDVDRELDRLGI